MPTEAQWRAKLEEAEETIRQLRAIPAPTTYRGLHLMPREQRVLHWLRNGRPHSVEEIVTRFGENASDDSVRVLICRLRKKLKPHGIEIVTRWVEGYSMPAESIAILAGLERP